MMSISNGYWLTFAVRHAEFHCAERRAAKKSYYVSSISHYVSTFFFFGFCRLLYRNKTKRQLVRSGAHRGFVLVEVAERVLRAVVVRIVVPEWPTMAKKKRVRKTN